MLLALYRKYPRDSSGLARQGKRFLWWASTSLFLLVFLVQTSLWGIFPIPSEAVALVSLEDAVWPLEWHQWNPRRKWNSRRKWNIATANLCHDVYEWSDIGEGIAINVPWCLEVTFIHLCRWVKQNTFFLKNPQIPWNDTKRDLLLQLSHGNCLSLWWTSHAKCWTLTRDFIYRGSDLLCIPRCKMAWLNASSCM